MREYLPHLIGSPGSLLRIGETRPVVFPNSRPLDEVVVRGNPEHGVQEPIQVVDAARRESLLAFLRQQFSNVKRDDIGQRKISNTGQDVLRHVCTVTCPGRGFHCFTIKVLLPQVVSKLAAAKADHEVHIWQVATGQELLVLKVGERSHTAVSGFSLWKKHSDDQDLGSLDRPRYAHCEFCRWRFSWVQPGCSFVRHEERQCDGHLASGD